MFVLCESSFFVFKMETKAFHSVNYKAKGDSDRERTGIAAVFGNIDSGGDITHPGAFAKTLSEGRQRWRHLWNHNSQNPPIAKVTEIKEVGRAELPEEILSYAPEATGGLWVKREYLKVPEADWVLAAIDADAVNEMSFGYDVIKSDYSEIDGNQVRNLRELALYDTSDVNWGMNPATLGAKNLFTHLPLGSILQMLQLHEAEYKAGRRNSGSDQILINALHDISMSLGCDSCGTKEDEEKQAEAAESSTSLEFLKLKTQGLRLSTLGAIK